jgi:hypothetical protein
VRILYNFASRSRPDKFFQAIANIRLMSASDNYDFCFKLDEDDRFLHEYLEGLKHLDLLAFAKLGRSTSKVHAINRDIPMEGWNILINMSDDIRWTAWGFDNIIRKDIEEDTFLHYPEPFADRQCKIQNKPPISVVSIMDKVYFDRFGYVYHNSYYSLWSDNEATEQARNLKKHKWVDRVIYSHDHPQAGKSKMDEQYRKTESFYNTDKINFNRRRSRGFPE